MPKNQDDFFNEKKPWSKVKDDLLASYLKPYFQKILRTGHPVNYIDCFAGRGEFLDGNPGSPLIAMKTARECLIQGRSENTSLALIFIEPKWYNDLVQIVTNADRDAYPPLNPTVIQGHFEQDTPRIVSGATRTNVFLYIDPYGIKDLDHTLLASFADQSLGLNTIELLVNLNSFGFIRAACCALKVEYQLDAALQYDDQFDDPILENMDSSARSINQLNSIAGGDYWQPIIRDYQQDHNGYTAERTFSDMYRQKLGETYRYVLSMPIRVGDRKQPKYRMVYATNHASGCVLMATDMIKRTQDLYIYLPGQAQDSLFDQDIEGEITDPKTIETQVRSTTALFPDFTSADEILARFYCDYGVICKPGVIHKVWEQLQSKGKVEVKRKPDVTKTGRPSTYWNTDVAHHLYLRALPSCQPATT